MKIKPLKIMKFCLASIGLLFIYTGLYAQRYRIEFNNTGKSKLYLENLTGNVLIEGYEGTEVQITYTPSNGEEKLGPSKGLNPIYPKGTDNTNIGLSMEKKDNDLGFRCVLPSSKHGNYILKIPNQLMLDVKENCNSSESLTISNMLNDVEVNSCRDVKLLHIGGSLVVSTSEGKIRADLFSINKNKPVSIISVSGEINIILPIGAAADLWVGTAEGQVYTNLALKPGKGRYGKYFSGKVNGGNGLVATDRPYFSGQLNGGGTGIHLQSMSGNIYLREK